MWYKNHWKILKRWNSTFKIFWYTQISNEYSYYGRCVLLFMVGVLWYKLQNHEKQKKIIKGSKWSRNHRIWCLDLEFQGFAFVFVYTFYPYTSVAYCFFCFCIFCWRTFTFLTYRDSNLIQRYIILTWYC